jgi:L-2-hydroxyglutarate oxidase LhgO
MTNEIDIAIIGAGVVGLAIASKVAEKDLEVYIFEKNDGFGKETSSRNSGVIHSGILCPPDSFNASLCMEGKRLIYELSQKYPINCKKTGKLIVARDKYQVGALQELFSRANLLIEMELISKNELRKMEPLVKGELALLLPDAGIIDAYSLMRCFLGLATNSGAHLVCKSEVIAIEKVSSGYQLTIREQQGISQIMARIVINCAGLQSDRIAKMPGIQDEKYKLNYFKGEFYSICSQKGKLVNHHPIYPMLNSEGLVGIHTVLDIDGRVRLGPDFYPVDTINYEINDSRKQIFLMGTKNLFPFVEMDDIEPESAGIMPRLYARDEEFKNFVIRHESDNGYPGMINLVGIESPGLTASPAIAMYVSGIVEEILKY